MNCAEGTEGSTKQGDGGYRSNKIRKDEEVRK